jgi:hypothetical protein
MAKFRFDHYIDIHWNGYDIVGDGGTIFSIPDQLYEEFESDLRPVEPSLEWTVVNEFLELQNSVSVTTLTGTAPIVVTDTSVGRDISLNASYSTTSHLHDGTYQPFGTYVTSVTGTAPITASGTTAITVGIDQAAITAGNASSAQATVYLVRNNTASTILKGTLVSATGAEPSGRIDIAPFSVTGLQDSELRVMGIATENISAGVNGIVMSFGTLTGLDTRGTAASALAVGDEDWDEGTILYAHPTVPGKLTEVRPQHDLAIAFTTVRHASTGQIAIRIVPGNFHLEWLHDVSSDSPSDGDIIQYKTSSSLWTKSSISSAGIAASVHTHPYAATVHTHGTTDVTSGNFVSTVTAGTGVTVTGGTGNASTPTLAIGQAVGTASDVTFNNVTVGGDIEHASQLDFIAGGAVGASVISSGLYLPPGKTVVFEGTTSNASEIELTAADATADRTITLPDSTGTVALTNGGYSSQSVANGTSTTITTSYNRVTGLIFTFTPTFNEQVRVTLDLGVDQTASPSGTVNIVGRIALNAGGMGNFSYTSVISGHGSPKTWSQSTTAGFNATAGTTYTVEGLTVRTGSGTGTFVAIGGGLTAMFMTRIRE